MPDINKHKIIQQVSPVNRLEIDDLIGNPPGWLLKSGISIVALVTIILIGMSALIKYPDKIIAKGMMTSDYPPIEHVNKISGVIDSIFVSDGQWVEKGTLIAYLQNNLNIKDLRKLQNFMKKYEKIESLFQMEKISFPEDLVLGKITADYARLQLVVKEFQMKLKQSADTKKILTLQNERLETRKLRDILVKEKDYVNKELDLKKHDFNRREQLENEGIISTVDRENSNIELIQNLKQFNNLDKGIIQNKIRHEQLTLEIQSLQEKQDNKFDAFRLSISGLLNTIRQKILDWEEDYYVKAEIDGDLLLNTSLSQEVFLPANSVVATILPKQGCQMQYVKLVTPVQGIGKIKVGDKAILKLDNYPYKEYGTITSTIKSIAPLPSKTEQGDFYEIKIALKEPIITNYNKSIPFIPFSSLLTEIITEEKSVLERIFEQLLNLINNR